ncbi:hypothetical protein Hte_003905 [Hypoxylon texense]
MACDTIATGAETIEYCPSWRFKEPDNVDNVHTVRCEFFDYVPNIRMTDAPWDEPCIHHMEEFQCTAESTAYAAEEMRHYLDTTKPRPRVPALEPDGSASPGTSIDTFEPTSSTVITETFIIPEIPLPKCDANRWSADDTFGLQIRSRPGLRVDMTRASIHDFLMRRMSDADPDMMWSRAVACLSAAGALRPSLDALDLKVPVPMPDGFSSWLERFSIVTRGLPSCKGRISEDSWLCYGSTCSHSV